jgi:Na+(H+)/acetate symporter ActP
MKKNDWLHYGQLAGFVLVALSLLVPPFNPALFSIVLGFLMVHIFTFLLNYQEDEQRDRIINLLVKLNTRSNDDNK